MKKLFGVLTLTISFCLFAHAEGFLSVHSPNGLDVWAVGLNGNVFHSVDGGATWSTSTQGTNTLRSVFALGNTVWMVGDQGNCFSSTNGGATFVAESPAGTTSLTNILFLTAQTGWITGVNGTILKTTNGGTSWTQQTTGTTRTITSLTFIDDQNGYAAGTNGTLLKTVNGGTTWSAIAGSGWTKDLFGVHAKGQTVYVTGAEGFCFKSVNGGSSWSALDFYTDSRVDVNNVFVRSADSAYFVGGGGFIRSTVNAGSSFAWAIHPMYAKLNDIFFFDAQRGWVCSEKNNAVMRTTDGGATWLLPQNTTVNYGWVNKFSAGSIGNTFMINPWNRDHIYVVMGSAVWMSGNRGDTWSQTATISPGGSTWSFYISPKDTNVWIAATSGGGKGIRRSTNRGQTWTTTLTRNFTNYGMPLEMDPDHPDTVIFAAEGTGSGPDGILYISKNFGATWDTLTRTQFRSPCDVVIVPGNTNTWYVGDGVTGSGTGQMWLSNDYGQTWNSIFTTTGSEIPMIGVSRLRKAEAYATAWGSGGVRKSVDQGRTWNSIASTSSTWGVDVAKDDPNAVMYGVYGGTTSYLSNNAGTSFVSSPLSGSNSAILFYDRATILAHQASGGVWKYNITYTVPTNNQAALTLGAPNGGEIWQYGTARNITWNSTNISNVKIEYRTSLANPWQTIIATTPASAGSYSWSIPNAPTSQARVRVSEALSGTVTDSSDAPFAITVALANATPASLNLGSVAVGTTRRDTIRIYNSGTATLVVSSIVLNGSAFIAGRASFSIPAGSSDTLSVVFAPTAGQNYSDTLRINCNTPNSPLRVPLSGIGQSNATLAVLAPNGGEMWQANSVQNITWNAVGLDRVEISYKLSPTNGWQRIAQTVLASPGSYAWTVPNTPSTQARVRIVDRVSGAVVDSSDAFFTITGATSVVDLSGIPTTYELQQNYPNPFNPSTTIVFGVPKEGFVSLKVFNMIGQEVATLVNDRRAAGRYAATFDTQKLSGNASSGLYFYRLSVGDASSGSSQNYLEIRKMMLLK